MLKNKPAVEEINALLPQTQCELCGHAGCRPYAEAIAEGRDSIDQCRPGGDVVLQRLAALMDQDPEPFRDAVVARQSAPVKAVIQEEACIGCKKCIEACPVDAIIGTGKMMHTVVADVCTGCELCVPPCPMDCIDMVLQPDVSHAQLLAQASTFRARYEARDKRLARQESVKERQMAHSASYQTQSVATRQADIAAAMARVRRKKGLSDDSVSHS